MRNAGLCERPSRKRFSKPDCSELLNAAAQVQDTPTPAQYRSPTPEQETIGFKQRREHRLKPDLPAITPADYF